MTSFDVIIPAYQAEHTLARAVKSALSPLTQNVFIIVDSCDRTLSKAQQLAEQDERIVVKTTSIENNHDLPAGVSVARNIGISYATADWVCFLDADDTYAPGYFDALEKMVSSAPVSLPLIHTCVVREVNGQVTDNHPLRYRFYGGNQVVSLLEKPHMIGLSVAAAAFNRRFLEATEVSFLKGISWSEDADFISRYLIEVSALRPDFKVGFCAEATYRYVISSNSTTSTAWANPDKYVLPFTAIYLPWIQLAIEKLGHVPRWLENVLLYELSWYIEADRQVIHPSQLVAADTLLRCTELIRTVLLSIRPEAVQEYALTPLSLDRRMMLLAGTGFVATPLNNQIIIYNKKPWQKLVKHTYFFTGMLPLETFPTEKEPQHMRWVSHTLFGVELVRERIFWAQQGTPVVLDDNPQIVAPFRGNPRLPHSESKENFIQKPKEVIRKNNNLTNLRKKLWHLRKNIFQINNNFLKKESTIRLSGITGEEPPIWFYMDRAHRASDNAEFFYRYAEKKLPEIRHIYALSPDSTDWNRLEKEGFTLVSTESSDYEKTLLSAQEILVSDISDSSLAPLLSKVSLQQRIIFLQHGIIRNQIWRWLNSRRIDVLLTSTDRETAEIIGDGTHYTLSSPEVWQTGLPRHDALKQLRAMSTPKDVLLIAPTWSPKIRHKIPGTTIDSWINDWTQWVANISTLNLVPVFFLHPNMEEAFAESNITPSIPVIRGNQVQEFLARAAVVVTDRSSIVNEGHFIGVPGVLVAPESDPLSFKLRDKYLDSGFILVDDFAELPSAVKHAVADDVTRFRQPADLPPEPSCEKLVSLILETRFE